jgi:hypothetical protein
MASERTTDMVEPPSAGKGPSGDGPSLPPDFIDAIAEMRERLDLDLLAKAFEYSQRAHHGQKRKSGEDYITHCVEVGKILADLYLDTASICAAFLHDVVEDTDTPAEQIEELFGHEIATIVDGLTKIGRVEFSSSTEQQAENFRKLLLSMARDASSSSPIDCTTCGPSRRCRQVRSVALRGRPVRSTRRWPIVWGWRG